MKSTARNFWKMIDDRNVTAIVMLCPENENNEVKQVIHYVTFSVYCRKYAISIGLHQVQLSLESIILCLKMRRLITMVTLKEHLK